MAIDSIIDGESIDVVVERALKVRSLGEARKKLSTFLVWVTRDESKSTKIKAEDSISARERAADIFRTPRWDISAKNLDAEKERKSSQKYPWVDPPWWRP